MAAAPQPSVRQSITPNEAVSISPAAIHPKRTRARRAFDIAAFGFFSGVFAQVLLAGWSLFNEPDRWEWHRQLGHSLEILAVILVVLAFVGGLPVGRRRAAIALFLLTVVQGMVAGIGGMIGTLHPANALIIGVIAYRLAMRV